MNRLLIIAALILGLVGLAHAGDMKHPSLPPAIHAGEPCLYGQAGCGGGTGVIDVTLPPYNCKADSATDCTSGIQQAIYDAGGATPPASFPNVPHQSVYFPASTVGGCYLHSAPILVPYPNAELKGDLGSCLTQSYIGDDIIQESENALSLPYAASLVTGDPNGHSLTSEAGQLTTSLDLSRVLNGSAAYSMTPRIASSGQSNIAFFMKASSSASGQIWGSRQAYPGTGNGAFSFSYNGSNEVIVSVNTVGGFHSFSACPAQTLNTVYEIELNWSGTVYRAWQAVPGGTAVQCDSWSSTSPMTQGKFEEMMMPDGGPHEFWPDGSTNQNNAFIGQIDSLRVYARSVHDAPYTAPTTKFQCATAPTTDWDLIVLNFDTSPNGSQVACTDYSSNHADYLTIQGGNIGGTAGAYIHDLDLCGISIFNLGGVGADGFFSIGGNNSIYQNLKCSAGWYVPAEPFNNDFQVSLDNWNSIGGHIGISHGAAWNESVQRNALIDLTDVACEVYEGGGGATHHDADTHCIDRGHLLYHVIENQSSGHYDFFTVDQEAANAVEIAGILLDDPANPYVFTAGVLSPGNTGVYVQQDNGGNGQIYNGTVFSTFGSPTNVIEYTNGTPITVTQLNNANLPASIPISNDPQYVFVNGTSFVTFAQLTSITCPTAGVAPDGSTGWLVSNATTCTTGSLITGGGTTYCSAICDNGATGDKWVH